MAKPKSLGTYSKKGRARKNDNTSVKAGSKAQSVKVLTSEDSKNVGRPGFQGLVPGPQDGKASIRRFMRDDPAVGITQPGADVITTTNIDLVGPVNPSTVLADRATAPNSGKKTIRPPRQGLQKR